jgi:ribosomal protein L11 methyltransferase
VREAWIQVRAVLQEAPDEWSVWHEAFAADGPTGTVQHDDPPAMSAYLAPGQSSRLGPLVERLLAKGAGQVQVALVPEQDWASSWKAFFRPVRIGDRIVVRPTWEDSDARPGELEIVLDPGQAFGTGGHATTRMCLELLEAELYRRGPGARVLDVGCGSGILSILAAKLGATVVGVDIDPLCIEASGQNAERNSVVAAFWLTDGEPQFEASSADVVLSNIVSAVLERMAPEAARWLAPGGRWIVSGVIPDNWARFEQATEAAGLRPIEKREEEGWVAAVLCH